MIDPLQCRMARVALGWTAAQLASAAHIGAATVHRFEAGSAVTNQVTIFALQTVLERAGVQFLPDDGNGSGLRVKRPIKPADD